jgi:hypothetical protein
MGGNNYRKNTLNLKASHGGILPFEIAVDRVDIE